jgi:hypothetical protein
MDTSRLAESVVTEEGILRHGEEPQGQNSTAHGLAFLALLSFVVAFTAARTFTTAYPDVVVVSTGIHFHHFWYGLGMLIVAGWLGIASNRPEYDRIYAVVFGLGLGLIGDETGLLLTLGDYQSELTYFVLVVGFSVAVMVLIAVRHWGQLEKEVFRLGAGERVIHIGLVIAGLAALPFAFGQVTTGAAVLLVGAATVLTGALLHRRRRGLHGC